MDMGTRRFGVAQTAADMCQVTKENIMEFAERMNRFGEGVFSRLAEIKRQISYRPFPSGMSAAMA